MLTRPTQLSRFARAVNRMRDSQRQPGSMPAIAGSSEAGLTLLECLVAIIVITLTLVAVTPPIFLAAATRIQTRKAEQALQIAQAEMDRVRVVVERGTYTTAELPATATTPFAAPSVAPTYIKSPRVTYTVDTTTGNVTITNNCAGYTAYVPSNQANPLPQIAANSVLGIDTDGDCQPDFLLQSVRTTGTASPSNSAIPINFRLGVRVYSIAARPNLGSLQTAVSSLRFTTGQNGQRYNPLAALYGVVSRNDSSFSLDQYKTLCPGGNTSC